MKGKRLFLLFLLANIIPAFVLSVIAFRSAQYEKIFLAQQIEHRNLQVRGVFQDIADKIFNNMDNSLNRTMEKIVSSGSDAWKGFPGLMQKNLDLENLFIINKEGKVIFPNKEDIIQKDGIAFMEFLRKDLINKGVFAWLKRWPADLIATAGLDSIAMKKQMESLKLFGTENNTKFLVIYKLVFNGHKQFAGIMGKKVNLEKFCNDLAGGISKALAYESSIQFLDKQDHIIASSLSADDSYSGYLLKENLIKDIPDISVVIYQKDVVALKQNSTRKVIFFYSIIITAFLIILIGSIVLWLAVKRELELVKMKSDFVSTVSHELRTPLASLRMFGEILKEKKAKTEEEKEEYYDIILNESERLSRLIENVLDFSRIEEGRKKIIFTEESIGEIITETMDVFAPRLKKEGFTADIEIGQGLSKVTLDKESIKQALFNLIDNAIKYSSEIKEINLKAYFKGNNAMIEVKDKGKGIPKSEQAKIFEKFYRSGAHLTGETKGVGLGLPIVMAIMKIHNGDCLVESKEGKGSTFTLVLPIGIKD